MTARSGKPCPNCRWTPNHPFLGRNTGGIRFAGSWSVRLRSGGFHISHIHHTGWMSSALYVSLPPEVANASQVGGAGSLAFGVPDQALGLTCRPAGSKRRASGAS